MYWLKNALGHCVNRAVYEFPTGEAPLGACLGIKKFLSSRLVTVCFSLSFPMLGAMLGAMLAALGYTLALAFGLFTFLTFSKVFSHSGCFHHTEPKVSNSPPYISAGLSFAPRLLTSTTVR